MNTRKLIKYMIMLGIIALMVDSLPRKSIGDDTALFLNPVSQLPPPAVTFLLDDSGSMFDLPCAVPDCNEACGLDQLAQPNNQPFFTNMGYDPDTTYPVFDPCVNGSSCSNMNYTGVPGAFYSNHVYYEYGCQAWGDLGSISSACNNYTNNPANCINGLNNYGYYYSAYNQVAFYSGNLLNFYPPKYVVLRKVISDIINYNANVLLPQGREVRVAIMDFADSYNSNVLISMNPPCSQMGSTNPNDFKLQGSRYNAIYGGNSGDYSGDIPTNTPLAEALIQLGAYYAQDNTRYKADACNNSRTSSYCTGYKGGGGTDPWCGTATNGLQCEKMYAVVVTDGNENSGSSGITSWNISNYYTATATDPGNNDTVCYAAPGGVCHIDEVAGWLHTYNVRDLACSPSIDTYTVGFYGNTAPVSCSSVPSDWQTHTNRYGDYDHRYCLNPSTATTACDSNGYNPGYANFWSYDANTGQISCQLPFNVLQNAANHGGGMFASGTNYNQIETALINALNDILKKNHTYGTPNLPQLVTEGSGTGSNSVFKAFVASFVPSNSNFWEGHLREYTGVAITNGTLSLYDKTGAPYSGTSTLNGQCSSFKETVPPPVWDAAADLSDTTLSPCLSLTDNPPGVGAVPCYLAPSQRHVYTISPSLSSSFVSSTTGNGDSTWSAGDLVLGQGQRFETSNNNLSPSDFGLAPTDTTTMDNIINYVLGPKPFGGMNVLGDVFHSDPMLVSTDALESMDRFESMSIPGLQKLDYQSYLNAVYSRPQIVIAGANDGMIHAFFAGAYTGGGQFQGGNYIANSGAQFDLGNGEEVWAFIPYDLLPKLQYMYNSALVPTTTTGQYWTTEGIYTTTSTAHVYYVDASPFIRDVYLPNVNNGLGLSGNAAFWHTIMIIGERLGGTYYICLDVTDTLHPKFMWEFTTNNMGFTFGEVAPNPPPIGAIWLGYDPSTTQPYASPRLRWVAMLSAGWDPGVTTNRGRGFYVVDVATGKLVWKYDQADDSNMTYPMPASVANIAPPPASLARWWQQSILPDLGGQVWQFSFLPWHSSPGAWYGSLGLKNIVRTCLSSTDVNCFMGQRFFAAQNPPVQTQLQQFYYIPSATWDPCNNLWVNNAAGDRNNPLSCTPQNYLYSTVAPSPYSQLTSPITASNLTTLTNTSGYSNAICAGGNAGWDISLSSFTGTASGTKSLSVTYASNGIMYMGLFSPDQNACVAQTKTQFSCNLLGGTGVLIGMAMYALQGTGIKAGQAVYTVPTGSGIPSAPIPVTSIFGSSGSSPTQTTKTPPNPFSIPVCGGGSGNASASTNMIVATSEGALKNLGSISNYNLLMYPYLKICIPQNVEQTYINSQNIWSTHGR